MLSHERIVEYVDSVCQKIIWEKARARVAGEMTNHILDARDYYMVQGLDEKTATENAIADMGDAAEIGVKLNSIHQPKEYNLAKTNLMFLFSALLTFGFLYALTSLYSYSSELPFIWYQPAPVPFKVFSYLGTWGLGILPFVLSATGLLFSLKASYKTSLLCSIGIPALSILSVIAYAAMNTWLEIPILDSYSRVIGEEAALASFCVLILPISCITAFTFAHALCSYKRRRKENWMGKDAVVG